MAWKEGGTTCDERHAYAEKDVVNFISKAVSRSCTNVLPEKYPFKKSPKRAAGVTWPKKDKAVNRPVKKSTSP